jgi:hypothetical protein
VLTKTSDMEYNDFKVCDAHSHSAEQLKRDDTHRAEATYRCKSLDIHRYLPWEDDPSYTSPIVEQNTSLG